MVKGCRLPGIGFIEEDELGNVDQVGCVSRINGADDFFFPFNSHVVFSSTKPLQELALVFVVLAQPFVSVAVHQQENRAILPLDRADHVVGGNDAFVVFPQDGVAGPAEIKQMDEGPDKNHYCQGKNESISNENLTAKRPAHVGPLLERKWRSN